MSTRRIAMVIGFAGAGVCMLSSCTGNAGDESDVASARAHMVEFRAAVDAARAAVAADNMEAVVAEEERARAALEAARDNFETADLSGDDDAAKEYAEALFRLGEFDLAANLYEDLLQRRPTEPALWMNRGKALAQLGPMHWPKAQQSFERSLSLSPDEPVKIEVHRDLGDLYARMGLFPLAQQTYATLLAEIPDDPRARVGVAMLDIRRGNVVDAVAALEAVGADAPRLVPDFPVRLSEALRDFEQARMLFPDTAEAHLAYAKLLLHAGRVPESKPALERSIALDESDYVAWNMLGSVAQQTGDINRSRQAFTRSLALNADQPRTRQALDALGDPAR